MTWIWAGRVAAVVFALLAATRLTQPDPALWALVYMGAAATAVTVARQRHVIRWVLVILIVFPVEMVVMSAPIGPWAADTTYPDPALSPYQLMRDTAGMALVALWATALVAGRRFRVDGVI